MKGNILNATLIPFSVTLSMALCLVIIGQVTVRGDSAHFCPDSASATDAWHSACPGSDDSSGCTDTYYTDGAGSVLYTVCGSFPGYRCCSDGSEGPVTKYVANYLCTLWGDQCNTNYAIYTSQTELSSVAVYQDYDCASYTNCPPSPE